MLLSTQDKMIDNKIQLTKNQMIRLRFIAQEYSYKRLSSVVQMLLDSFDQLYGYNENDALMAVKEGKK